MVVAAKPPRPPLVLSRSAGLFPQGGCEEDPCRRLSRRPVVAARYPSVSARGDSGSGPKAVPGDKSLERMLYKLTGKKGGGSGAKEEEWKVHLQIWQCERQGRRRWGCGLCQPQARAPCGDRMAP